MYHGTSVVSRSCKVKVGFQLEAAVVAEICRVAQSKLCRILHVGPTTAFQHVSQYVECLFFMLIRKMGRAAH